MPSFDEECGGGLAMRPSRSTGSVTSIFGLAGLVLAGIVLVGAGANWSVDDRVETSATCRAVLQVRECPIFSLAWSPDGGKLAVSGFSSSVKLWDARSGEVNTIEGGTEQPRFVLGWSDDGRQLILGGLEVPAEVWDLEGESGSDRKVTHPEGLTEHLSTIARASGGNAIRVRGSVNHRSAWLPASPSVANSAAFSKDGRSIVTAEADRSVRIWEAATGRLRHTLQGEERGTSCVAMSPDGSKAASGGGGPSKVWDSATGALVATLGPEGGGSAIISFSPDGTRLAQAGWDGTIRVWDLSTGLQRDKFGGHDGQVLALAWSPDGKTLASGGYDSSVRLWSLDGPSVDSRAD